MLILVPIGYLVGTDENHTHYLLYENKKLVALVIVVIYNYLIIITIL